MTSTDLPIAQHRPEDLVFISQTNQLVTDSFLVAKYFSKRHDNIVQKIRSLECSSVFTNLNFKVCHKNNELQNGKLQPFYQMTKDGFIFLVMSFTGKKAATIKEAYINAFNLMAEKLLSKPVEQPKPLTHQQIAEGIRQARRDRENYLRFQTYNIHPVRRGDGQIWIDIETLALAAGYRTASTVLNLYNKRKHEFTQGMTDLVALSYTSDKTRVFSLRGVFILLLNARSDQTKAFRQWVTELMDLEAKEYRQLSVVTPEEKKQMDKKAMLQQMNFRMLVEIEDGKPTHTSFVGQDVFVANKETLTEFMKNPRLFSDDDMEAIKKVISMRFPNQLPPVEIAPPAPKTTALPNPKSRTKALPKPESRTLVLNRSPQPDMFEKANEQQAPRKDVHVIRIAEVLKLTGFSRSHIYRLEEDEDTRFPKKIQLGTKAVGWVKEEIEEWLDAKINSRA